MSILNRLVIQDDCVACMRSMAEASVDAIVTDPPYDLAFMGKKWDGTGIAFDPATWKAALRVLKPGGHLLAFGGSRTFHRMAVAIEDAGFEIRDVITWLYGSGFPKSMNVAAAIDKAGVDGAEEWEGWGTALKPAYEPIILARKPLEKRTVASNVLAHGTGALNIDASRIATTDALGGGAEKRVAIEGKHEGWARPWMHDTESVEAHAARVRANVEKAEALGRWPANVVLSHTPECVQTGETTLRGDQRETGNGRRNGGFVDVGSDPGDGEPNARVYGDEVVPVWDCVEQCPVRMLDAQTGELTSNSGKPFRRNTDKSRNTYGAFGGSQEEAAFYGDKGGASRFFYCSKASTKERSSGLEERNPHPTVKPVDLMRWLVRLITPPDGVVLDPFTGSGTTGVAAVLEGFRFVGIEREDEYIPIARARIAHAAAQTEELAA